MNSFVLLCFCYVSIVHLSRGSIVITRFVTGSTQLDRNLTGLRLSSTIAPPLPHLAAISSSARFVVIPSAHLYFATPPLRFRSATTIKNKESSGSDLAPPPGPFGSHRRLTTPTSVYLRSTHCSEDFKYFRELRLLVYVVYGASPTPQATTTSLYTVVTFLTLQLEMVITISGESFASGPRLLHGPIKPFQHQATTTSLYIVVTFLTLRLEMVITISGESFASGPRLLHGAVKPFQHRCHVSFNTTTTFFTAFSFYPLLVVDFTVQECGLARFARYYDTVASPTHYAVSSIDGSSQSQQYDHGSIVQECGCASFFRYYATAAPLSHYTVSNIDGSSQRPNYPKAFCLLSDVCSHMSFLNKSADWKSRSSLTTTCWAHHGNVEFRDVDLVKLSVLSSFFILSASLEAKVELEIHIVSSVSFVGLKAEYDCFIAKSSQLGLRTLNVVYGSETSRLEFLPFNIPTSNRRINVVFDYQLFLRTIAMGTKVELLFGFLYFAEHDSPRYGFIFILFVLSSSFVLPLSLAPGSSASVVNIDAR